MTNPKTYTLDSGAAKSIPLVEDHARNDIQGGNAGSLKYFSRFGWAVVILGFFGFVAWALFAPLDQGVAAPGVVIVDGQRKVVQHPSGGIVKDILVSNGDVVELDQVLIRLNDVPLRSARDIALSQWVSARASEARLISELGDHKEVQMPEVLLSLANSNELVQRTLELNKDLFETRKSIVDAELSAIEENIRGVEVQIAAQQRSLSGRFRELNVLDRQISSLAGLVDSGYVSRNRALDLDKQKAQIEGLIASSEGEKGRLMSQLAELKLALARRKSENVRMRQTELTEIQREANSAFSRLSAAEFDLSNVEIRSPADGVVVGLNVFTSGGVIGSGQKLMDILPNGLPLEIEARIAVNLIDSIHVGLPVDLIFSALNVETTPVAEGTVVNVSADRLTDERTTEPYYLALIRLTELGETQLKGQTVRPGMPVDVFFKTGERSFMNYLLKPFLDRSSLALTEE